MRKYSKDFKLTPSKHDLILKHIQKMEKGQFEAETKNYIYFYEVWLKGILGYDLDENVMVDEKEEQGRGKSEFILRSGDKKFMVVELKDQKTDLDKPQNRVNDKRTPVDQAFDYAQHTGDIDWILVSNYNEFRLYNWHKKGQYISFKAEELLDKTLFSYFMLSFSKKSYIDSGIIDKLMDKTVVIERELEKEFYKLYNETRLMLIKEFEELNNLSRLDAIHYAQMIMNRYMFICFAEDIDLLPAQVSTDTILTPILKGNLRHGSIWQRLNELFLDINEGNEYKKISQYNGGIFKEDLDHLKIRDIVEDQKFFNDVYQDWKFEEYEKDINTNLGPYGQKVNPIYRNMLTMSTFDFSTELDVNILGHIFENSIGDIEELKEDSKGRRKKEGIFYTPDYITDYICRNTIIPYLSKSGKIDSVIGLINEYSIAQEIETLESKVMNIKILDPACGSGAFLNKASDILLEIHKLIYDFKKIKNTTKIETKGGKGKDKVKRTATHIKLDSYFDEVSARREILIHNIYGVDLNEESVDITKLALFLKVCQEDRKLPDLESNIKCGNSLIDDPNYSDKPLIWEKEFEEIFKNGGFDVVIGNPPWGAKLGKESKKFINDNYRGIEYQIDTYVVFMEKTFTLLKDNGHLGIIAPSTWLSMHYFKKIRNFLINRTKFDQVILFKYQVFEDVTAETSIIISQKNTDFRDHQIKIKAAENKLELINKEFKRVYQNFWQNNSNLGFNILFDQQRLDLVEKIFKYSKKLSELTEIKNGLKPYESGKGIPKQSKVDVMKRVYDSNKKEGPEYRQYIIGRDINKFSVNPNPKQWIKYGKWLAAPRKFDFSQKKIVIRQTSDHIIAAIDKNGYLDLNNVHNVFINKKMDITYEYLLVILNSKLIDFIYKYLVPELGRVFAEVKGVKLAELPIYLADKKKQSPLIEIAEKMVAMNLHLKNEINGFYDWIMHSYNIEKLSQKLEKYYELSFDDFLNEVKKKKVNVKSRENYQTLKEEFEKSITIINPLLQQIKETDNEIDQMVYNLYGLTNEEIKIIEDSLNG
jgi:type I restriction-modification system DNA methylase subunit